MDKTLLSVGIDVGTTTSQMVVSQLTARNKASGFAVPRMDITERKILYESPVHFTPLLGKDLVDGQKLRQLLQQEYENAGITPQMVDTGAVIITGETSRRENARTVVENLSTLAGDFVVATAGPDLESALAARGAGAAAYSEQTGAELLHMDIGGGTSNLALIRDGRVVRTGCLNVGGRLIKLEAGRITYLSPVLQGLTSLQVGDTPSRQQLEQVAELLASALEMAAGLTPVTEVFHALSTREAAPWQPYKAQMVSFSGGVAECIRQDMPWDIYGDLGVLLGQRIRGSKLCAQPYHLGEQAIRATVMGAGCYSVRLSGSTVFCRGVQLPVKGLGVVPIAEGEDVSACLSRLDGPGILYFPHARPGSYDMVRQLARKITQGVKTGDIFVCTNQDMAKALGQAIALLCPDRGCVCLDGLEPEEGSYLDIGQPVGPALPVVIKTLILGA